MAQPFLYDLVSCIEAPAAALSAADGQIRPGGAQGLFVGDVRYLSELVVTVDGSQPVGVGCRLEGASAAAFVGVLPDVGDPIADPTVRLERRRKVGAAAVVEELRLVNDGRVDQRLTMAVRAAADLASIHVVKQGGRTEPGTPQETSSGIAWAAVGRTGAIRVEPGAEIKVAAHHVELRWRVELPARTDFVVRLEVEAAIGPDDLSFAAPVRRPRWHDDVEVRSANPHLGPLVGRSLADLSALLLTDGGAADGTFVAAGNPWFFTLFGRDSLWTASFALPIGTELAEGTLRVLARRQGRRRDAASGEEPGKILHEVRSAVSHGEGHQLAPVYFGTIDATPLWISLLHDAWSWGLPTERVASFAEPLVAALDWVIGHGAPGRSGFLAYHDVDGRGLANQGWKDSGDSIQDAAGTIAPPPITLCEAQAYAHRAALDGARLLDALNLPGAGDARTFARDLAVRFRTSFWVDDAAGPYPAVAIDGEGRRVDSLTSNIGHLLRGELLDEGEIGLVARWLADPRLSSGYGLRTLDASHPRFNPLGYHSGSVWPHDTAIAIGALRDTGQADAAATLMGALLRASLTFDYRLPELFGGWGADTGPAAAYPAACRPQAWSAAASIELVRAALGLRADVPAGTLQVTPHPAFAALYPLEVRGLQVAGHRLDITVSADGRADVVTEAPVDVVS